MAPTIYMTLAVSIVLGLFSDMAQAQSVLQYHDSAARSGNYVIPGLTPDHARTMHLDPAFDGRVEGHVYAQPLLVLGAGHELLLVATEDDVIEALDAGTGKSVWRKSLGHPVPSSMLPCGNINPLGITGTPVINEARRAIYLDAMVTTDDGPQHLVFGLSVDNGMVLPGFPVNVAQALAAHATTFTAADQNQRGALLVFQSTLFIPYGGHFGDCGRYHGWVVGLGLDAPHPVNAWSTRATGGGIWAPGGIASDGHSLFVTTGNTFEMGQWGDGEAVLRLSPNLKPTANASDYFAPANWRLLDRRDADLGGTSPLLIDVRDSAGTVHLMLALGKDGKAYLLNRDNLGGIGGALAAVQVASEEIITAPATYPAPDGGAFVVFHSKGINCPAAVSNPSLSALKIQAHPSPAILTAWCSGLDGAGEPIVTTTDGSANPIVWIVGAEGDNRLHAFDGENGKSLLTGPQPRMQGLRHFATIVATQDHLYVPADGRVFAFTP